MDLSAAGVQQYWRQKDDVLSAVLASMGQGEQWVLEGSQAEELIHLWEIALDDPASIARMTADQRSVIELLGWLSTDTAVRIVEHLEQHQFGAAATLATVAERESNNPLFRVFIDRLIALSRTKLLAEVFSPDRLLLVEAAIAQREAARAL